MAKQRISITLDDYIVNRLNNQSINKSDYINKLLSVYSQYKTDIDYIEALTSNSFNLDEAIELGIEQVKLSAEKQRNTKRFTEAMSASKPQRRISRDVFIKNIINEDKVSNVNELQQALLDASYDAITKPATEPPIANQPYRHINDAVRRTTSGQYLVRRNGAIVKA